MSRAPEHAWVLLKSGKRLDLLDPHPMAWDDEDLATGLARTYRWGGHSKWDLPLSVAQHSITVLLLHMQQALAPLPACDRLHALLHDAEEGLLGYDALTPLKPHLGEGFQLITGRLVRAIAHRYRLPDWTAESHAAHKVADRLAAASEAAHVVGWSRADIRQNLRMGAEPLDTDPVPTPVGLQPWEPWPPNLAASMFLDTLRELRNQAAEEPPPLQAGTPAYPQPALTGRTFVVVDSGDGMQSIEGEIVGGVREEDGTWDLDGVFTVLTVDGDLVKVNGWCCMTEVQ